jgi:hypothetical protein
VIVVEMNLDRWYLAKGTLAIFAHGVPEFG